MVVAQKKRRCIEREGDAMRIIPKINSKLSSLLKLAVALLFLTLGCQEPTNPQGKSAFLSIDLMWDFQDDSVQVDLDDEVLYRGIATTDWTVSSARRIQKTVPNGMHHLEFRMINHSAKKDTFFNMPDTLSAGIYYNRTTNMIDFLFFEAYTRFD